MAKGIYIGVNGIAKKVKKLYVGVSGVAKKVKKAYVGVGGVAKLAYTSSNVKIVSFANGTDAEIKAMLNAYYADEITWEQMGWAVGDTRKIHLNAMQSPNPDSSQTWAAQDITVVIVDHDHTDLATAINGHTKACITVQTREMLSGVSAGTRGTIYVNGDSSKDMTFTKWSNLYMRTYLNDKVWGAFPTDFKAAIKTSKHNRHTDYNTSVSEVVNDNLFLPSYPEIFGTAYYQYYKTTSPAEGTQFAYFTDPNNIKKYVNSNGSASSISGNTSWWNGSASSHYNSSGGYYWGYATSNGAANYSFGSAAYGLAPAFAM